MTGFILLQNVAYEGSSLKGIFASLEAVIDHIDSMDGYALDGWKCDRFAFRPLDDYELKRVAGATAGWHVPGPSDLSFTIFSAALGAS